MGHRLPCSILEYSLKEGWGGMRQPRTSEDGKKGGNNEKEKFGGYSLVEKNFVIPQEREKEFYTNMQTQ